MSKRFTDTEIWQKEWFLKYTLKQKVLIRFLFDNCDVAGVYEPNFTLLSVYIGEKTTEEDILSLNQDKLHIIKLANGHFFLVDFISFQYGELSENCKPHQPVFKSLQRNGIDPEDYQVAIVNLIDEFQKGYERVTKGLDKGIERVSGRVTKPYKEKEKEKYNLNYNNINNNLNNITTDEEIEDNSVSTDLVPLEDNLPENKPDETNSENENLFNEFWSLYTPVKSSDGRVVNKGSKEEAKKKFLKILKGGESYANILRGLQNYINFCRENDQLTCGVSVFLNQKRWLDDYNCETVDAEHNRGQRQEPTSIVETYAQIANQY